MSQFTDDTLNRYLDQQPGMREALLRDPVQHQQAEQLRQTLAAVERAMGDEGVADDVRRRVVNRVVWGDAAGRVDRNARLREEALTMLTVSELPPEFIEQARSWGADWETIDAATAGPVRPDEEPTT